MQIKQLFLCIFGGLSLIFGVGVWDFGISRRGPVSVLSHIVYTLPCTVLIPRQSCDPDFRTHKFPQQSSMLMRLTPQLGSALARFSPLYHESGPMCA